MRAICKANSGKALPAKRLGSGYTEQSIFHVSINKEYTVFGMVLWRSELSLLLSDDCDLPDWYPVELFSVKDARLPSDWFFSASPENEYGALAIWGYERLVYDEAHYDSLLERDPLALRFFDEERRLRGWQPL